MVKENYSYDKGAVEVLKDYSIYDKSLDKKPIYKKLSNDKKKGIYTDKKADKLFYSYADKTANKFYNRFGYKTPKNERKVLAQEFKKEFERKIK